MAQVDSGAVFENVIYLQLKTKGTLAYFQKKTGQEIGFILEENTVVEVKETADKRDLKTLQNRSSNLSINNSWLIGRHTPNSDFREWIWSGTLL